MKPSKVAADEVTTFEIHVPPGTEAAAVLAQVDACLALTSKRQHGQRSHGPELLLHGQSLYRKLYPLEPGN